MSNTGLVKDILDVARNVYLNDSIGITYSDTVLLNQFKLAYDDLQNALELNDIPTKNSKSSSRKVSAGDDDYGVLPNDFILPIKLEERASGTNDNFTPMVQRDFEPEVAKTGRLIYWCFREGRIRFLGALNDRDVLLYYQSIFPSVVSENDLFFEFKAASFLAAKLSAYVHIFISQNETLAKVADDIANKNLEVLIRKAVKKRQSIPARPRPYRASGW